MMAWEISVSAIALLISSTWAFYAMRDSELSMFVVGATYAMAIIFLLRTAVALGDAVSGFLALPGLIPSFGMFFYAIARFIEDYRLGKRTRVVRREEVQGGEG